MLDFLEEESILTTSARHKAAELADAQVENTKAAGMTEAQRHRALLFALGVLVLGGIVPISAAYVVSMTTSDEWRAARVVNGWLDAQRKGESGSGFWLDYEKVTTLFAVRDWEIVNNNDGHHVVVRIESSTRGGQPIIVLWNVYLKNSATGELLIDWVSEAD